MVDRQCSFPRGRWSSIQSGAFTGVRISGAQMPRHSDRRDGKNTTHRPGTLFPSMVDPERALAVSVLSAQISILARIPDETRC